MATADDVAKSIKPKMITVSILSIFYDCPRIYLNVNLFGSLCSFYYNIIKQNIMVSIIRGEWPHWALENLQMPTSKDGVGTFKICGNKYLTL